MGITVTEESKLRFYFQADRLFWRSSFGLQLERARSASGRSESHGREGARSWHWNPPDKLGRVRTPAMHVASAMSEISPAAYEVASNDLLLHAEVSRRMRRLWAAGTPGPDEDAAARQSYAVLALYYGEPGARWAAAAQDRHEDPTRKKIAFTGIGPGAIACLYRATAAGQELLRRERLTSAEARAALATDTSAATGAAGAAEEKATRKAELTAAIEAHEGDARLAGWSVESANKQIAIWTTELQAMRASKLPGQRAVYAKIAAERRRVEGLIATKANHLRSVELLRSARSVDGAGLLSNPTPEPESAEALAALAIWRDACRAITASHRERGATVRAEDLPPCPAQVPAARLPRLHAQADAAAVSDDDQLEVALLLQRRQHSTARRLLLDRANLQAEGLLTLAWTYWGRTNPASQPERLPQRPGTILAHRTVARQPVVAPAQPAPQSTLAEEASCPA